MDLALANAQWVLDFQGGAAVERGVQDALGGVWMFLLSHIYLAAQIVVLPGVLVAMYRWAPRIYPRLRNTVIVTWMLSLPVYALFPVAPPRLAGLGMTDAVSETVGGRARRPLDDVLQPDRGRAEPALRVRDGDRDRRGVGRRSGTWLQGARAGVGPDRRALDGRDRQPLRVRRRRRPGGHARRLSSPSRAARASPGSRWRSHDPRRDPRPPPRDARRPGGDPQRRSAGSCRSAPSADRRALWPLLYRADPDVVVLDDLQLAWPCGRAIRATRVVIYAAGAGLRRDRAGGVRGRARARRQGRRHAANCWRRSAASSALPAITPRLQRRRAR